MIHNDDGLSYTLDELRPARLLSLQPVHHYNDACTRLTDSPTHLISSLLFPRFDSGWYSVILICLFDSIQFD